MTLFSILSETLKFYIEQHWHECEAHFVFERIHFIVLPPLFYENRYYVLYAQQNSQTAALSQLNRYWNATINIPAPLLEYKDFYGKKYI